MAEKIPIVEIFGPVIQGEGAMIGTPTTFIRFGGCDFRCKMCDSMYAVDPELVKAGATYYEPHKLSSAYAEWIQQHACDIFLPKWVTFSGGNPCIWEPLHDLISWLQLHHYQIAVETQGTIYQDWLQKCDIITVSPKGPGMGENCDIEVLRTFIQRMRGHRGLNLKIVYFDDRDIQFASTIRHTWPNIPMWLSVGNPFPHPGASGVTGIDTRALRECLLDKLNRLTDLALSTRALRDVRVTPQLHVLMYGNERGR